MPVHLKRDGVEPAMLDLTVEKKNEIIIIHIYGDLLMENFNDFTHVWRRELRRKPVMVALDCSSMGHMDSVGIKELLSLSRAATINETELIIYDLSDEVRKFFEVAKLDHYFNIISISEFQEICR